MYTAQLIGEILQTKDSYLADPLADIEYLVTDSRRIDFPEKSLFFAISGTLHDGHDYIQDAVNIGVKNIVAERDFDHNPDHLNVFIVPDSVKALQKIAAYHRSRFHKLRLIAITGSNGKTTVKEWLSELIADQSVVKSPKSYNSQIGVPLSLWQIRDFHRIAIIEAGTSKSGEMALLEAMIKPTVGIITNIGDAHAEGFESKEQKLREKLGLFKEAEAIIYSEDDEMISAHIRHMYPEKTRLSWGFSASATVYRLHRLEKFNEYSYINLEYRGHHEVLKVHFTDDASLSNICHCIAVMLYLGYNINQISERIINLRYLSMRLEMKAGINDSIIINDSYNADLESLKIALEFQAQQAGNRERMLVITDFFQTGLDHNALNRKIAQLLHNHEISDIICVGDHIRHIEHLIDPYILFRHFETTEALLEEAEKLPIQHKIILVKGARAFALENFVNALTARKHSAVLETDLQAVAANLRYFSERLSQGTGIIAVIKAAGYGSGSIELAKFLEFSKVDYLAVAFADEGVELRKAGIQLPVMVLNPESASIRDMIRYRLEPEVYAVHQLREILDVLTESGVTGFGIHLKLDTGMHRLGFDENELDGLLNLITDQNQLTVKSIFSHLSSSEDPADDDYTHRQAEVYEKMVQKILTHLDYVPFRHLLNTAGILRFPQYHYDMVRLGLGLYGIDVTGEHADYLEKVHTLKASVLQIKSLSAGASVGYNRKEILKEDADIATVNIGYADGMLRHSGNRRYTVRIGKTDYPIIGNVCMDLLMVYLGKNHEVKPGDEVIIFGKDKPIETLAEVNQTIPYEILSRISTRIKRVYVQG
ncbi:MAG: bifunctional UDP-N-acetylmuramoyl-tripeptide:D-alanyl-D-alanine ligase/alanine racemase [Saprospiraceae bacterium]|nr:bifunctional UDP-N-acetylmuramoyl-tripeptide:D-alanyl-D-alanine ligase/alanine racemase [Saprospiraceae bacterium]